MLIDQNYGCLSDKIQCVRYYSNISLSLSHGILGKGDYCARTFIYAYDNTNFLRHTLAIIASYYFAKVDRVAIF